MAAVSPTDRLAVCAITRGEILYGLARLPHGKRRSDLEAEALHWFDHFPCLSIPEAAGDRYALVKWEAQRSGTPLEENDLWIAATAVSADAVLVSTDSDFERVHGLRVEDWTT